MTPIPSLLGQMAFNATLCGPIAQHVAGRPSLRDVAAQIIEQQWQARGIEGPAPLSLVLYRALPGQTWRFDSLADALIERYCRVSNLNLTPDSDFLSVDVDTPVPSHANVDLHAVEQLLNECGPFLLEAYQLALIDFWSYPQSQPQSDSPWEWLVHYLQAQYMTACELEFKAGALDTLEVATARVVAAYPEPAQREQIANLADVQVWLLYFESTDLQWLEPDLASALMIERPVPELGRTVLLIYTLSGKLYRFASRDAFVNALAAGRARAPQVLSSLSLRKTTESMFKAQTKLLLEQQMRLIDNIAQTVRGSDGASIAQLVQRLDDATSLVEICTENRRKTWVQHQRLLPQWLQEADRSDRRSYATHLIRLAQVQQRSAGKSFLYEVPDIVDYAQEAIRTAVLADHPEAVTMNLEEIEVLNDQVTGGGTGSGGSFFPVGTVQAVRLSLVQLALGNLSMLRSGTVTIRLHSGAPVPDWLTRGYLESLVTRLDIGTTYPNMLRQKLLDDPQSLLIRQALFVDQIREQVPLLALEKYLRKTDAISARGVQLVQAAFRPLPGEVTLARLRPLSFLRRRGAVADVALNAYLIEATDVADGPCVLYRPLHRQPLIEFATCQAFFEALCETGEVQEDVLARLKESVRPIYARGGFEQPHIVRYTPGAEFAPIDVPAPATVGTAGITGNVLEHLYRGCAEELVAKAEAQSISNSENRWMKYEELGWLMLNTLLPFANGPMATSVWMLQFFVSLQSDLQQPEASDKGEQQAMLLFNLALMLFSFRSEPPLLDTPEGVGERVNEPVLPLRVVDSSIQSAAGAWPGKVSASLDFSWTSIRQDLSGAQRKALDAYRVDLSAEQLGQAIPNGLRQGLYMHNERLWARVEGSVYQVAVSEDGVQVTNELAQPGPWLRQATPGVWTFDLGLRLRGGMPLNRRIAQMREANRQRVTELEQELRGITFERQMALADLKHDIEQMAVGRRPSAESLKCFAQDLRGQIRRLGKGDETYQTLNQLQSQPNFKRTRASNLFEMASTRIQLLRALRFQFSDSMTTLQALRLTEVEGSARLERHGQGMEQCRQAYGIVNELTTTYEEIKDIRRQLSALQPLGTEIVSQIDGLLKKEPSFFTWQSAELSLRGTLILDIDAFEARQLVDTVLSARVALQMQATLEGDTSLAGQERIDVLDGSVRNLSIALQGARNYAAGAREEQSRALLDDYISTLQRLLQEAETELAGQIRTLNGDHESEPPQQERTHALIKTRNRGMVLGQRRRASGNKPETVVVLDSLDNTELARYEQSTEEGIWQPVAPTPQERPTQPKTSLASLLKRVRTVLFDADQQIQRARRQARTATVAVEMEEILIHQARPLEDLAQEIEGALTMINEVDSARSGQDAAVEAKTLSEKADEMRRVGRELRIAVNKSQSPTVGRVAYLKAQGEIIITRPKAREASARRKGLPQDYLDEYVISDKGGQPLWYAHFHYASLDAEPGNFTAAHLKTREQRFDGGQFRVKAEQNTQTVIQIYRSLIDRASAEALFLTL